MLSAIALIVYAFPHMLTPKSISLVLGDTNGKWYE